MISLITFAEFEKHISCMKKIIDYQDELDRAAIHLSGSGHYKQTSIHFPNMVLNTIRLLELICGDANELISYFVFELNFGRWGDNKQVRINGKDYKIQSVEELWNTINVLQEVGVV